MSINPIQYQRVFPARKDMLEKINLYKELGNGYTYLGFNLKKAPFNDVNVRQAINYAIDKDEVIKGVLLGLGEPIEIAPLRSSTSDILNLASVAAYSSDIIDYKKNKKN